MFLPQVLLSVLLVFAIPSLHAAEYFGPTNLLNTQTDIIKITGPADLKKVTAERITVIGPLHFEDLNASQLLKVIGTVMGTRGDVNELNCMGWTTLSESKIQTLIVTGRLDANHIEVKDQSNITGVLTATNSKFKDITITSSLSTLKNSSANIILFEKNKVEKEAPVLKLLESSVVNGDIIFNSQNGKVILDKSSKVIGTIKGGVLEQQ